MANDLESALVLRMETSLAKFERELRRARGAGRTTAIGIEKDFDAMGKKMAASAQNGARGLASVVNVSSRGRAVLQNTAAQLSDIAVQLEMGTSPARVMSQQLPQLLGGFGSLGGVLGIVGPLLGTIAAVGIPLAAMFFAVGTDAEKSAKKVKTFEQRLSDAQSALAAAEQAMHLASGGGMEDLRKKYGALTLSIQELARELSNIEQRAAKVKIGDVLDVAMGDQFKKEVEKMLGGVGAVLANAGTDAAAEQIAGIQEQLRNVTAEMLVFQSTGQQVPQYLTDEFQALQEELAATEGRLADIGSLADGITVPPEMLASFVRLQEQLRAAREAGDFRGVQETLGEMVKILRAAGDEIDQSVVDGLVRAQSEAAEMASQLGQAEGAAAGVASASGGIAGPISAAANEAARLRGNLAQALAVLGQVTSRMLSAQANQRAITSIKSATVGDPVKRAGLLAQNQLVTDIGAGPDALDPREARTAPIREAATQVRQAAEENEIAAKALEEAEKAWADASRPARGGRGGGGSRGGRSQEDGAQSIFERLLGDVDQVNRQIEMIGKSRSEIAALQTEWKALDEAKRRGVDVDKTLTESGQTLGQVIAAQSAEVGNLTEQLEKGQIGWRELESGVDAIAGAMAGAIVEGENMRDALKGVFRSIVADLLQSGIKSAIMGIFQPAGNSGGGIFSAIFGGLFGGGARPRANGGPASAGTAYLVNENTPNSEIFVPSQSGAFLNVPQAQAALRKGVSGGASSGGAVMVTVGVDESGNLVPLIQSVSGNVAAQVTRAGLQSFEREVLPRKMGQGTRG